MSDPIFRVPDTREEMEEMFNLILQLTHYPIEAGTIFRTATTELVQKTGGVDAAFVTQWREGIILASGMAARLQELILEPSGGNGGGTIQ